MNKRGTPPRPTDGEYVDLAADYDANPITAENAARVGLLARWGKGAITGMALSTELDVEHHQVVGLATERSFGVVAIEPLVHPNPGVGGFDPAAHLVAGGWVVLDHGHDRHAGCAP